MDIIEKHPEKPWNWYSISENPNITMEDIEKYPEKPWVWDYISMNPNITMDMIEKYPEKPWNWLGISINPNITIDFIEKHLNKINFSDLSNQKFTFENNKMKKKEGFLLLEKKYTFHKLQNLYVINQYM
jgi:hypothetical protein